MHVPRRLTFLALSVPAVMVLSSCSSDSGLGDTDALNGIEVNYTDDGAPEVMLRNPVEADEESAKVIDGGDGDAGDSEQILEVSQAMVDPSSGSVEQETFTESIPALLYPPIFRDSNEFVYDSLAETDLNVGGEIVLYEPANEEAQTGESLILIRVDDQYPAYADGEPEEQSGDLPAVVNEPGEQPELEDHDPDAEAPSEVETEVLIEGDGDEVEEEDEVVVHYTGWKWSDGEEFDSSWTAEEPAAPEDGEASEDEEDAEAEDAEESSEDDALPAPATFPLDQVVDGWSEALVGQHAGSRLLMVLPPEAAYGEEGDDNENDLAGETLIFVVDIVASVDQPEQPEQPEQPQQPELSEEEMEELQRQIEEQQEEIEGGETSEEGGSEEGGSENGGDEPAEGEDAPAQDESPAEE